MGQGQKSTLAGGRQYGPSKDSPVETARLVVCDHMTYAANTGGPIANDGYAPRIPDVPAYNGWNADARLGKE